MIKLEKNAYFANGNFSTGTAGEHYSPSVENNPCVTTITGSIKRILAPTDLSALSETGVRYALNAARELDAEVIIYHVITGNEIAALGRRRGEEKFVPRDYPGLIGAYEMRLRRFMEQKFSDVLNSVKVKQKVEFGTPEKTIVEMAKTERAELIIMATSGKSGLARLFLGSVTERVIRNAPCPVVAIPSNFVAADKGLYRNAA